MLYPVEHPRFVTHRLAVESAGLFSSARLWLDDRPVELRKMRAELSDDAGATTQLWLKGNGFDPVPKLFVDGEQVQLARPLRWYEYAWMGLPLLMVLQGGLLGALLGIFAVHVSSRVFRSDRALPLRYAMSGVVSLTAAALLLVGAFAVQLVVDGGSTKRAMVAGFVDSCVAGADGTAIRPEAMRRFCTCVAEGLAARYEVAELVGVAKKLDDPAFLQQTLDELGCVLEAPPAP